MNATASNDNDLIRAYLDNALDDAALTAFELRLLQDPALQDQVELEQALRHGLRAYGRDLPVTTLARTAKTQPGAARIPSRHPLLALAASFVAGAVIPALFVLNMQHGTDPGSEFAPRGNVPTLLIDPVRSANADVVLVVAPNSSLLLLQVPVYPQHANERYSLRIEREDGASVAELDELVPDADDLISALVPASTLPSGRYRLDLTSRHDGTVGEQRRIVLRVTAMG
ncbi:hypothetical protein [Chiayiivirga flava]|uniref:Uncharacterized protein n=1 Tax=Chiayiivirga flava TaxID=659595 RepID=A0A7W8G059_9GAMM|nr:hypothetical protein [Chiayiivirga flava]MBB5207383.1 hypothetical protein [Chiayiivirga flava]